MITHSKLQHTKEIVKNSSAIAVLLAMPSAGFAHNGGSPFDPLSMARINVLNSGKKNTYPNFLQLKHKSINKDKVKTRARQPVQVLANATQKQLSTSFKVKKEPEYPIPFGIHSKSIKPRLVYSSKKYLVIDDSIPAGFEALAGPQTNFVDVYFNERKVGTTRITGTDATFVFDAPQDVLAMLEDIKGHEDLSTLLSKEFSSNAHLICYRPNNPVGCGQIEANPIGTLYNPSELKVEIFLSEKYQKIRSKDELRYMPTAERKNSVLASFDVIAMNLQGEDATFDISSRALAGYGNGHVVAEVGYNSRLSRRRLRELRLSHFFKKHEFSFGTYAYHAGGALSDFNLLGASFSSTLKTRIDLEHAFSSELVVFLTRRSVVQLVVRGQIYSGKSYDAGNQVLNTRALPEGSYEVEIHIMDPVAGERTELRAFTKSTQIPPRGEWVYSATAGAPVVFEENRIYPKVKDTVVLGASVSRRITDASATRAGALQLGRRSFLQSEYLYLGREFSFQVAATVGEENTLATSVFAGYTKNRINGSFSLESLTTGLEEGSDTGFSDVFHGNYLQVAVSLGKSFKSNYVGLRSSNRDQTIDGNSTSSNQHALSFRRSLFNNKSVHGFLDASIQKDGHVKQFLVQLKMYFKQNRWRHALSSELNSGETREGNHLMRAETLWQSKEFNAYQVDVGAYASQAKSAKATGLNLDVQHPLFSADLSSDWNDDGSGVYQQNTIASMSAYIGLDKRGGAMGGQEFSQAGVIVSVKGEPAGEKFDIAINGVKVSTGQIGSNQFIGLRPFKTYTITLIPKTVLSNGLDQEVFEFTLYPGNVQRINITTEQNVLLIANFIDESGELLEEGVVETHPNPQILSAGGYIQAEVTPGMVLQVRRGDGRICEFVVPEANSEAVLIVGEPLLCIDSERF